MCKGTVAGGHSKAGGRALNGESGREWVAGPERSAGPDPTEGLVSHSLNFCVLISCLCTGDQSFVHFTGISESLLALRGGQCMYQLLLLL